MLATSSAVPALPKTRVDGEAAPCVILLISSDMAVAIVPGATAFTLIPLCPTSLAAAFVKPITACLLAA